MSSSSTSTPTSTTPTVHDSPVPPPSSTTTTTPLSTSSPASTSTTTPITSTSQPATSTSSSHTSITTTSSQSATSASSTTTTSSSSSFSSTSTLPPQTSTTSSPSSTSTLFQTTVITTDSQGSVVTVLTTASAANAPSSTAIAVTSSTSHTGAIVGGTVGGVAALAILAVLLIFCLRRQRRKDDFDGNFDPDRVGHSEGPLDLAAGEVEPYTYPQENAQAGHVDMREASSGSGSMHQFYNTSPGMQPDYTGSRSPTDTHTTTSFLSPNAAPVAGVAYAPTSSSRSPPRSAKEREAFSRYNTTASSSSGNALASGSSDTGMHVVNQPDDAVVVHQDGGRVRIPADEEQIEREIPPTYDSIPSDSRR